MDTHQKVIDDKDWLDLYWKHFHLHSDQRMKMVQFYLSLIVVLFGALFTLHSLDNRIVIAEVITCIGIGFVSLVFALLDYRTSLLIKDAEDAIKKMETAAFQSREDVSLGLFSYSEQNDQRRIYISYSKCIRFSEILISILGFWLIWMICDSSF